MSDKYFIKSSLKPNRLNISNTDRFWTPDKFTRSNIYLQYDVYKFCRKLIKKAKLKSVLDIGCGTALKLMELIYPVCKNVYGINEGYIIDYVKKKYSLNTFYKDNIEDSNLNLNMKFDLIISSDVIEHLEDPDKLLDYIKKYSHQNTFIIISTPERDITRGKNAISIPKKSHMREWNLKEFNKYLKSRNFRVLYQNTIKSYRILLDFKQPIAYIKKDLKIHLALIDRYGPRRFKHNQIAICKINNSNHIAFKTNIFKITTLDLLKDKINVIFIILNMVLFMLIEKKYNNFYKKLLKFLKIKI